ncbi:23S rRNA (pseudouridine(1915)-N(3))-methyltransferase RlmH [Lachnospiraceae bacterium ZAX-1]
MNITILAVGKIKEKFYRQAIEEFEKRLSRYCKLKIIEVADEKTPDHAGKSLEMQIKEKEGNRLSAYIKEDATVWALAIEGNMLNSFEFAAKISSAGIAGYSHITFVIGGSLGLAPFILKRANYIISFSNMTFPHQLIRVILLEQIYRSYRIIKKEPYHK